MKNKKHETFICIYPKKAVPLHVFWEMRIRIVTLGCKLNFAESSALMRSLEAAGHVRAKAGEEADVVIVNTCTVTDTADHKDRQAIHRLRRENPNAKLIVTGCYAELLKQRTATLTEYRPASPDRTQTEVRSQKSDVRQKDADAK